MSHVFGNGRRSSILQGKKNNTTADRKAPPSRRSLVDIVIGAQEEEMRQIKKAVSGDTSVDAISMERKESSYQVAFRKR